MALQAAANGQLAQASGEPFVASLVNVVLAFVVLGVPALVVVATTSLDALPTNPALYVGGLLGGFVVVVFATVVQTVGVLRLGLATVAGQTAGALVDRPRRPGARQGGDRRDRGRRRDDDGRGGDQRARAAAGAGRLSRRARRVTLR